MARNTKSRRLDAQIAVAKADAQKAESQIREAMSNHQQTLDELKTKHGTAAPQCGQRRIPRNRAA